MRRACLILVMLIPAGAWAQAPPPAPLMPQAVVKGPATVPAGGAVMLDASASVHSPGIPLQWHAIEPPDLVLGTLEKDGQAGAVVFFTTDSRQGAEYLVAVSAAALDPLTHQVSVDTAVTRVTTPVPVPPPPPAPTPVPVPSPSPSPAPLPAPTSPLALAAQQYYAGFPALLRSVGDRIGAGTLPDKNAAVAAVSAYTVPLAHALDAAFVGHIDAAGKVTDPAALKAALYDAAAATGGP